MSGIRSARIEVNLSAIRHNYAVAKSLSNSKAFAVIKSNAYGHGAVPVAQALSEADGFAVVTTFEAIELRQAGIAQPVLVMQGPQSAQELEHYSSHNLMPVLHHEDQIAWFKALSERHSLAPWLKIDTGMGRLGVSLESADKLLLQPDINWYGALTHFACADLPGNEHTASQINSFNQVVEGHSLELSLSNSAATIAWPESYAHWSRPGLMLYGANPLEEAFAGVPTLKPAMRVSAPIIAVKNFSKGAGIGYGQSYVCEREMRVGYLGIGYGDGLPRVLGSDASVRIGENTAPIIGRVSMDSIALDLSALSEHAVGLGDPAILWGPEHRVELMAEAAGTISYEIFTGIRGNPDYLE